MYRTLKTIRFNEVLHEEGAPRQGKKRTSRYSDGGRHVSRAALKDTGEAQPSEWGRVGREVTHNGLLLSSFSFHLSRDSRATELCAGFFAAAFHPHALKLASPFFLLHT
jgi:hypothetical protein